MRKYICKYTLPGSTITEIIIDARDTNSARRIIEGMFNNKATIFLLKEYK